MTTGKINNAITVKYDYDQLTAILDAAGRQKIEKSKIIRHAVELWIDQGAPNIVDNRPAEKVAESTPEYGSVNGIDTDALAEQIAQRVATLLRQSSHPAAPPDPP